MTYVPSAPRNASKAWWLSLTGTALAFPGERTSMPPYAEYAALGVGFRTIRASGAPSSRWTKLTGSGATPSLPLGRPPQRATP